MMSFCQGSMHQYNFQKQHLKGYFFELIDLNSQPKTAFMECLYSPGNVSEAQSSVTVTAEY